MPPKLMIHQEQGVRFLEERGGCGLLAMEPGVGKTLTTLEFLNRNNGFPAVVIALVSNLGMWKSEIQKWYPHLSVISITGTLAKRQKAYAEKADVYIMGYETFRNDKPMLPVTACVLDESGKVRTPTAKVSKAIRAFRPRFRIALDGTPVSNTIADLWNITEWIAPGTFYGNWWAFRKKHAIMSPYILGKVDGWRDEAWIKESANKHIFWKKKTEVLHDLPAMTQTDMLLEPTAEEKRVYKQIKTELRLEFEGREIVVTNALALLMRLRQAANGIFTRPDTPTKTKAVIELMETLPASEKVVIFSQFSEVVKALWAALPYKCVIITGEQPQIEREQALQDFENDPEVRAIIMTSAGEKGLNLQCASYLIQYDLVWSAASEEQRIGRIWRHGQTRATTVWNLLMEGTVDQHMRRILNRKKDLAESISMKDIEEILA